MDISSEEFRSADYIPKKYTCEGEDINPPLEIHNIPQKAKSLALILDDPDAPGKVWVHWVVFDIPVVDTIEENTVPGKQGINDFKKKKYNGPCPPKGTGAHRYYFKVYALDITLNLKEGITKEDLVKAMKGHVLEEAELMGIYKKK